MIGKTISHYKIIEKIAEGGMGVVYKAEDTKLNRTVALKFLRGMGFDDEEHKARFVREAQAAAGLSHANICTIYEIDEEDDWIFISMAYIDGGDVAAKVRSSSLGLDEALNIAIQVGEGLEAAHSRGIIHRDIKSANIMTMADGHVKILDFGLAKVSGGVKLTRPQTAMGTISYMSPEQARGEQVDNRTDLWSLGVCLYEMLTGELPFRGDYDTAVSYAILNEVPIPVSELRAAIPREVERIIIRALSKNAEERYASAANMVVDMKACLEGSPEQKAKTASSQPQQASIAVLPFADMSPTGDQEYFCYGIAEEIISSLVHLRRLRVASRTSAFAFKGVRDDIREIGKKLGVTSVLEGSVRKSGDQLRITAQLINVESGYHMWSEQYDRQMEDIFVIQEGIAQSIVEALRIRLSDTEKRSLEKVPTKDVAAYDYYLRGRRAFYQTKHKRITDARDMFSKAIKCDANYARAYAGMADCYSYLFWYFDRREENLERAMMASQKALSLDSDLAEAHAARGLAVTLGKQYDEAEHEFETAIRLNPSLWEAYYFYARALFVQGKMNQSAEMFEKACEVSPEDYQAPMMLGFILKDMDQDEKGDRVYRRGLENVEKYLETNPDDSRALYLGSSALIDLGENEKGLKWAMRAVSLDPDDSYIVYGIACNYARLGEVDEAVYYLEKATTAGFAHWEWIENDGDIDPIRDDPRYKAIMKKLKEADKMDD